MLTPRRPFSTHDPIGLVIAPALLVIVLGCSAAKITARSVDPLSQEQPLMVDGQEGTTGSMERATRHSEDVDWLRSILLNPALDQHVRRGAAERLLAMNEPAANRTLVESLRSEEPPLILAVVESVAALPAGSAIDAALIEAAADRLRTATAQTLDPLADMLARHDRLALQHVASRAADTALPVEERIGLIYAFGTFRSRAAAKELISILEPDRDEPVTIVDAVCNALSRGTGLPYGTDANAWRRWWAEARDQPREEWLTNLVQRLSEQIAASEREIREQRRQNQQLEQRLAEVYRELFPSQTLEERLRLLPGLLDDSLATVRTFALDRIARLLRDSVRIPEEVQHALATRLEDEIPAVRLQTVRLLDQLNDEATPARLAARLSDEQHPDVVSAILEVLTRRPAADSLEALLRWLREPEQSSRAAAAIWQYHTLLRQPIEPADVERIMDTIRRHEHWPQSPALVRLTTRFIPHEQAGQTVAALLDSEQHEITRAAAEGLVARNWTDPVLERAANPALTPFVLRILAHDEPTFTTLRQLVSIEVDAALNEQWTDAVHRLAGRFPLTQLLEVDEIISGSPTASLELRAQVLARAVEANNTIDRERRVAILTRLAWLRLQLDNPEQALAAMGLVPNDALVSEARRVKFEAAIRAGRYEIAEPLYPDVDEWIAMLDHLSESHPDDARILHEQIVRRFGQELEGQRKADLEAIAERLGIPREPPSEHAHEHSESPA